MHRPLRPLLAALSLTALGTAGHGADVGEKLPVVPVALVQKETLFQSASFQAELRPFLEVEMHAKVSGYLESIQVDAGDMVKESQVIATLDQPELRMEIEHAVAEEQRDAADVERAEAVFEETHLAFTRMKTVTEKQPNLIAQQDVDAVGAKDRAAAAAVKAARQQDKVALAQVKRLQVMEGYTRITAPFNGVITRRYADPGALIQAGTSSGSQPLVRISQNDLLRAVFPVSVSFVTSVRVGDPVQIRIEALRKTFSGKVARFSRKVDTSTRTMDVEVDLPNADLAIVPGMYATVELKTELRPDALSVPVEAVSQTGDNATVYVVSKDGKIEERPVEVGLETQARLEITKGVSEGEMVLTGSRAAVLPGQTVAPKISATEKPSGKVAQSAK